MKGWIHSGILALVAMLAHAAEGFNVAAPHAAPRCNAMATTTAGSFCDLRGEIRSSVSRRGPHSLQRSSQVVEMNLNDGAPLYDL